MKLPAECEYNRVLATDGNQGTNHPLVMNERKQKLLGEISGTDRVSPFSETLMDEVQPDSYSRNE